MEYRQSCHLKADSLYGAQCALSCPQVHMNERRADIIRPCILVLVTLSHDEMCPFGYSPSRRKTAISKKFSARSKGAAARCLFEVFLRYFQTVDGAVESSLSFIVFLYALLLLEKLFSSLLSLFGTLYVYFLGKLTGIRKNY